MCYRWLCVQVLLGCVACASYRAQPLPSPAAVAMPGRLEERRPRVTGNPSPTSTGKTVAIDPADGIDPDEAAVLAVLLNPDLIALRDEHDQAGAQIVAAGILPNPVLGVEYAHPYGNGSAGTNDAVNVTLSWDLKPLIARSAKKGAAEASLSQVDLGIVWQEWQVAQQARLLVVRLGWLRQRVLLAEGEYDHQAEAARALAGAGEVGDATLEQLGVQRASLAAARNTLFEIEQLALETESELLKLLGNPRQANLRVPAPSLEAQAAMPRVSTCLSQRLDLQALRQGYEAQQASLRAAVLDQFPDISIGLEHQHDEGSLDFVGAFVSVGLPVFDRNQGEVAIAQATRRRLQHEYDARVAAIRADLDKLARYLELTRKELPRAREAITSLEKIETQERSAVASGDMDRLSYEAVRAALLEQRLKQAALSQALAESNVGLETICGVKPMARRAEP